VATWFIDTAERRARLPALAIECARAAEGKVKALVETQAPDSNLSLRIGMHAGSACFGDFGAKERIAVTLLGPDVNLAARYEQAKAEHLDSIRVSPELKALVERGPPPTEWLFGPGTVVTVKHGVEIEIFSPQIGTAKRTP
jgi:class 3 adenylate cyclase